MSIKRNSIRRGFIASIALFFFVLNCYAKDSEIKAELTISQGGMQHVFTVNDFQKRLHLAEIEVEDPVYQKHKRYAGYWLSEIFDLAGIHPDPKDILVFSALDGYQVRISLEDVINSKAKALVAIRDLDAAPEDWQKIQQGKAWVSPAPFYLVWQTPPHLPASIKLPWPYQMVEIDIQRFQKINTLKNKTP